MRSFAAFILQQVKHLPAAARDQGFLARGGASLLVEPGRILLHPERSAPRVGTVILGDKRVAGGAAAWTSNIKVKLIARGHARIAGLFCGRDAARRIAEVGFNRLASRMMRSRMTGVPDTNNPNQCHFAANVRIAFTEHHIVSSETR